ncbi:MAG: hypothetical protein U0M06_10105 [Clostridia bacterium]|nr:hypothetical protein [Clostridia bacterium]
MPEDVELPSDCFYTPDYETDIRNDPEYLALNRTLSYRNGAVTVTVIPDEYSYIDEVLPFIADYIDTMINGDFSSYPQFFSEEYKKSNIIPQKFTMQRIYNITVEKISEEYNEKGSIQYIYMLDYMIKRNDGTLRRDIDSDSSRPQYLVIRKTDSYYIIDSIITYYIK